MARRAAVAEGALPDNSGAIRRAFQWLFWFVTALVVLFGSIWIYTAVEQFLISDDRFVLSGPPEPGTPSSSFRVEGTVYASEQQISDVFLRDFGRSIYLCPIPERRRMLLAVDWVKEASVSRVWPNQIIVRISERKPVAFVQVLAADRTLRYALIDGDGVLLEPQRSVKLALPVLAGINPKDTEAVRRERVRRFLRLQTELGAHMSKISEIDVSDLDNLKVIQPLDSRAITLMLGNQKYKERLENFLNNVDEIRQRMPNAVALDLRLKGRITAIGGSGE